MPTAPWIVRLGRATSVAALFFAAGAAALASETTLPTTPGLIYRMYDPGQFYTLSSDTTFGSIFGGRFATGGPAVFSLALDLPAGAAVEELTFYFVDDGTGAITFDLERFSPDAIAGTGLGEVDTTGINSGTHMSVSLIGSPLATIDNSQFTYNLVANMPGTTSDYRIYGARVGYRLQVSPAPATGTFNDVPTSDFGFQYIEALAASGITGGCGGGKYCPDSPVTRRQMAIFLSKALGLYWQ